MDYLDKIMIPAITSLIVGIISAYITAYITIRLEVRKKLAEALVTERSGKLLDDLSLWVARMMKGIPRPIDCQEGKDITPFLTTFEEYDSWLTINMGNLNAFSQDLSNFACELRDSIKDYLKPVERKADEINDMYDGIIKKDLSNLSRMTVKLHKELMRL